MEQGMKMYTGYVVEESKKRITVHKGIFESLADVMAWSHDYDASETKIYDLEEENDINSGVQ